MVKIFIFFNFEIIKVFLIIKENIFTIIAFDYLVYYPIFLRNKKTVSIIILRCYIAKGMEKHEGSIFFKDDCEWLFIV